MQRKAKFDEYWYARLASDILTAKGFIVIIFMKWDGFELEWYQHD